MGLFDSLFGQKPVQAQTAMQPQSQGLLGNLSDPLVALPLAGALMQPGGLGQNLGQGFAMAGQGMAIRNKLKKDEIAENATAKYLESQGADTGLVELAKSGAGGDALRLWASTKKSAGPNYINAGDGNLFNETTGEWIKAPGGGSSKPPQIVELFDEQTGQPYKATWDEAAGEYKRVGGMKAPNGMSITTNPDGTVNVTQGGGKLSKLNVDQAKNAGFYKRAAPSNEIITKLEDQGTSGWNKTMGMVPGGFGNYGLGEDAQKYQQAKRDFVNAILRRESGAVISDSEFANADQQYFPQPGDGPKVIEQKRANRENALAGLRIGAGQSEEVPTIPAPGGVVDYTDFFGGQ